jgi:hypothetical protein
VNKEQAVDFSRKVAIRKGENRQAVSVYDFNERTAEQVLDILNFSAPDKLWLDFVHKNRHGTYNGKLYDLIIGPVANDDVYATLLIYEQGILNTQQTIEALKVKKLYNQFVFKSTKALTFLNFNYSFDPKETA